jgi:hypothetical protein
MKTTCKEFEQFDKSARNLRKDREAAARYDAFQREERERLVMAGVSQNQARELLPLY